MLNIDFIFCNAETRFHSTAHGSQGRPGKSGEIINKEKSNSFSGRWRRLYTTTCKYDFHEAVHVLCMSVIFRTLYTSKYEMSFDFKQVQ